MDKMDLECWTDELKTVLSTMPDNALLLSQEHSAQLDSNDLKKHQTLFANGKFQILNCSTTMEMGVDIGSISLVGMTNVPPYSHNYLQRAGRAGRAKQGQSCVWTVCDLGEHDQKAWKSPLKWVEGVNHRPHVSLDSGKIVTRHIAAYLLTLWGNAPQSVGEFFMQMNGSNDMNVALYKELDSVKMLLTTRGKVSSVNQINYTEILEWGQSHAPIREFEAWLVANAPTIPKELLEQTGLEGVDPRLIAENIRNSLQNAESRWYADLRHDLEVFQSVSGQDAMRWRYRLELHRLATGNLIQYLGNKGVLPLSAMPNEVIQLTLPKQRQDDHENDNHRQPDSKRKSYPSRPRPIAIREFAPGTTLIIDGKVHTSERVLRNWKNAEGTGENSQFKDTQTLRDFYLCHQCGSCFVPGSQMGVNNKRCGECGADLSQHLRRKMLIPSGFIAQLRKTRSVDEGQKAAYEVPRIGLHDNSQRILLPNDLGELRVGRATIVHLNGGSFQQPKDTTQKVETTQTFGPGSNQENLGTGASPDDQYHICMVCGFSRPASQTNIDPLREHLDVDGKPCGKFEMTDYRHQVVSLGAMQETDACSISLKGVGDPKTATTLALALRNAFALRIGLRSSEIGWSVRKGTQGYSLVLFDQAPGGADFTSHVSAILLDIINDVKLNLETCSCENACHSCLLSRETQYVAKDLDRKKVLDWMQRSAFIERYAVPQEMRFWGDTTFYPNQGIVADLYEKMCASRGDAELRIYLDGTPGDWSLYDWNMLQSVQSWLWANPTHTIRWVMKETCWAEYGNHHSVFLDFMGLSKMHVVELIPTLPFVNGQPILCEWVANGKSLQYIQGSKIAVVGKTWPSNEIEIALAGYAEPIELNRTQVKTAKDLYPNAVSTLHITADEWKSVSVDKFTTVLFQRDGFRDHLSEIQKAGVQSIEVVDQYIRSPLSIRILYELISVFRPDNVVIKTTPPESSGKRGWWNEYPDAQSVEMVIKAVLKGMTVEVINREWLKHDRTFTLRLKNGIRYRLDMGKGVGIWKIANAANLDGSLWPNSSYQFSSTNEASLILKGRFPVSLQEYDEANIWLEKLP